MARTARPPFSEQDLTKGQLRKLNALRKSVGDDIGMEAFGKWLAQQDQSSGTPTDRNAGMIAAALEHLIKEQGLRIPRGGYAVRRGRGRVIVTRTKSE